MTEQQPYELVRRYPDFELRSYPSHVVAQVNISGSFSDAGNRAFRALFGYISGDNRSKKSVAMTAPVIQSVAGEKIAMTAPVVQRPGSDAGEYVVAFVLPKEMTIETAPAPANSEVEIRSVAAGLAAAVTFSGRWSESSYEDRRARLLDAVRSAGLHPTSPARFARFDPPFKPWFLRRNEVVVDVKAPDSAR